jgi:hypothetical protein
VYCKYFLREYCILLYFFFLVGLGFEPWLQAFKAGILSLEPHLQSILLWLFFGDGVLQISCLGWP